MKKHLTFKQKILVAGTLFGMFFGAGNLIFPVHLGQLAGRNVLPAMIGFIITAVGIPILGVAAIGVTHSDGLQTLSGKVGKGYGIFFTCLLYLTIGPLFAIPRCATVSFTTGITPLLGADSPERLYLLLFSAVFFAFVLFFSLRPGKITVWIGKIINPLFLFFFAVLMLAALLAPGAAVSAVEPVEAYRSDAFFPALIEGYGTMDAIAGLAFGIVVIDVIRRMGVDNDDAIAEDVLSSGLLTGILMAVIYIVTILMGTQSRGLFEISENGGIALTQIAGHYLGGVGLFILAFTITFACLKTSIGLVTSCSETFVKMTHGKLSYKAWAILFTLFSFAVSNVGLSAIIEYSIPVLMLTARGEEVDRIVGLTLGADDYVVKPFSVRELVLRIRAILRRGNRPGMGTALCRGALLLDVEAHRVTLDGQEVALTATEFRLLEDLMRHAGAVRTREQLLNAVWGYSFEGYARTVDTHVRRLRAKLGEEAAALETVRGVGYRLRG